MPHATAVESGSREQEVYCSLTQQVAELLHVKQCGILLYDPEQEALVGQVPALGVPDEMMRRYRIPLGPDSPARMLWDEGQTVVINDVATEPLVQVMGLGELAVKAGIQSTLLVGLRHEGALLGVLQPSNKVDGSDFNADDVRLISILASQVALTLQYARLLQWSQRQAQRVASLYDLTLALAQAVDLEEILHSVFALLRRVLDYDLCFVTLATPDGRFLQVQAADGKDAAAAESLVGLEVPLDQGINAWIYREGQPSLVDDADQDPRRLHVDERTDKLRSAVGAPLIVDGQPIGTIYATRSQPHAFQQEHLDFISMTGVQVAGAVQRARLLDEARRRAEEMETVSQIGAAMAASLDREQILQTLYEQAGRIMDTSAFYIALHEPEDNTLDFCLMYDEGQRLEPFTVTLDDSQGFTAHVVRTGQPLLIRSLDEERDRLPVVPVLQGREPASWLGVPIIAQDRVIGVISAQSYTPYAFTGEQMSMLLTIANQAGIGLQNTRLYTAAQKALQASADERDKLVHLHRVIVDVQRAEGLLAKLHIIADGIHDLGWGRVIVSLRDAELNATDIVCAGVTPEDEAALRANPTPGKEWQRRFGPEFDRFRLGRCYYLPYSDPWVRETIRGVKSHREQVPGDSWHPRDLLHIPLSGRQGRIVGIIGVDDPADGQRPTVQNMAVIELFAEEAALIIENAELLSSLKLLNTDLQEMLTAQARLLQTVEELASPVVPAVEGVIVLPLIGQIDDRRAGQILDTLLSGVEQYQAQVAILDITGVAVVDTQVAHYLMQSVRAARLLGAEAILVGIRPEVAQALTTLGVNLRDVVTRSNLQSGFQYALSLIGKKIVGRE